jgi:NAD(P)-dependent dehydrogenase (short-subunit alcohol dehydrogenase family)
VVVNDLGGSVVGEGADASVADEVVGEIRAAGGRAVASHESVATPEGGAAIVQAALDEFGRIDAVVSNAGIYEMAPFEDLSVDQWRRMINVHLDGGFYLAQPAYRAMMEQGSGRFVFISSSGGAFGIPYATHYSAAKAGIVGLSNNIAIEGARHGILSNTVMPYGHSRMADLGGEPAPGSLRTRIEAELVVPLTVFLASRACELTHQNYSACAGRYARVFMAAADGWYPEPGSTPSADDLLAHFAELTAIEPFSFPGSIVDEMLVVAEHLGIDI